MEDAFGHHVWATISLIDACAALTAEQLEADVPGMYGSILVTMRHLVGADASYLFVTSGERTPAINEETMDLSHLRAVMERHDSEWAIVLARNVEPTDVYVRHREDGSESQAPISIRLAQVLHHGTDHRSQICTALTMLGIEPPQIDVWDFADAGGRLVEIDAPED